MQDAIREARDAGLIRVARISAGPTGFLNYEWECADAHLPALTVYERDEPQRTGLLDADGNPLIRTRNPIGFDISGGEQ